MHIKLIYADRIVTYDTKADGMATTTKAQLQVQVRRSGEASAVTVLELWSDLKYDRAYDGEDAGDRGIERGNPEMLLSIDGAWDMGLFEFLSYHGEHEGLLRFDVDGETIYQAEPAEDVEGY